MSQLSSHGSPWRALTHRNFALFLAGHGMSVCGTWMQSLAQAWLVWRLTQSPFLLGLVEFLNRAPILFLGIFAGLAADRWPRYRLMVLAQSLLLLLAGLLAALTLSGTVTVGWIMGLAFLQGLVYALETPVRQTFMTDLVPRADMPSAIGLNSSIFNSARVIGPSFAGLLVSRVGEGICFLINAASFLVILGCLAAMRLPPPKQGATAGSVGLLREALGYAWRTPHARALLLLALVLSIAAMPYTTLLPVFAANVLGSGPNGLGLLMAATGIGALTAALRLARRNTVIGLKTSIARAVTLFGASLLALALSQTLLLSMAILVVVGFSMVSSLAGTNTMLQSLAPEGLRGRVVSLYTIASLGCTIFGSLLAGTSAGYIGAQATVAAGGLLTLIAALLFWRALPAIARHLEEQHLLPPEDIPAN
ncbi:MAG: MFS transporter [Nitrospiraceae bacterium]